MLRLIVIFPVVSLLVGSAAAFPSSPRAVASESEEPVEARLTKSNACKPKYRHKKAAQDLREKAHCLPKV
jgi:hypothetical protein